MKGMYMVIKSLLYYINIVIILPRKETNWAEIYLLSSAFGQEFMAPVTFYRVII